MSNTSNPEAPLPRPSLTRRRNLLVAGGLAGLLVAGGTIAAVVLLGGDDSREVETEVLRDPVSEEPEELWTWSGEATSLAAVGDVTVVGSEEAGEVVALDEDGEELWTSDLGAYAHSVPLYPDIVFVMSSGLQDVHALSIDDGEVLWTIENGYLTGSHEAGLVYTDADEAVLGLVESATGEEVWEVSGVDSYALTEDAAYVLDDGRLSRLAIDSGEEEWSVDTGSEPTDNRYVPLVANDDLVVVSDAEAVAYDAGDGAELWSEAAGDGDEVTLFSSDRVSIATVGASAAYPVAVTVYDRDGEVGALDVDPESGYFYAEPFEADGNTYVYDSASGRIFDEGLEEVGRYDGDGTLVDGGLYTLQDDGKLSYYELTASSPAWSIETPWSPEVETEQALVTLDGRLAIVTGDGVVSYG